MSGGSVVDSSIASASASRWAGAETPAPRNGTNRSKREFLAASSESTPYLRSHLCGSTWLELVNVHFQFLNRHETIVSHSRSCKSCSEDENTVQPVDFHQRAVELQKVSTIPGLHFATHLFPRHHSRAGRRQSRYHTHTTS